MTNGRSNIINGMVWKKPSLQNAIVFSGYDIAHSSTSPVGRSSLFSVDISFAPGLQWAHVYDPPFNASNYQSIPLDYIVQPLHNVFGGLLNQYYYQPKALVKGTGSTWQGYQFASPRESGTGNPFSMSFVNTDIGGDVDPNCMGTAGYTFDSAARETHTNFGGASYTFAYVGAGAGIYPADISGFLTCGLFIPRPSVGDNAIFKTMYNATITVYPNPAKNHLSISGLSEIKNTKITLYNIQGKEVLSRSYQQATSEERLDISTLQGGAYFLKVSHAGKTLFLERVIKK